MPLHRPSVILICNYREVITSALNDHCTVSNHSAAICSRMSPTHKSTGTWVALEQKLARKGLTAGSQILTKKGDRDMGQPDAKEIASISSAV